MKRLVCFLLTVIMLVGMIPMAVIAEDGALSFTDVQEKYWFHDAVKYCVDKGYISGMTETTFVPNANLTRAQFVTILAKFDGVDLTKYDTTESGFEDVKVSHWWNEEVCWAVEKGITSGISETKFGPNNDVTRAQLARFFYVYTEKNGTLADGADISAYPDVDKVQDWAKTPVEWAVAVGLISGVAKDGVNYLDPNGKATRAQAAVMFMNYDNLETEIVYPDYDGRIVFWGDSLTQGIFTGFEDVSPMPYPETVGKLLNCEIKNYGIGSEMAYQIAGRQGAIPVYAYATEDEPFVIPADTTPVEICLYNETIDELYSTTNFIGIGNKGLFQGINPITVGGVEGTIDYISGSNYSFTRLEAGEEVTLTEMTLVETFGMKDKREDDIMVIWIGHNDCPESYDTEKFDEIIGYIDAMIEYAGTEKYLVMGLMAERYVPGYAEINAAIKAHMEEKGAGEKFLDIRTYLADPQHLVDLGIEPNQGDNTMDLEWMEKGWIPESLQSEKVSKQGYSLHLNQQGYDLVAEKLAQTFMELGYLD